MRRSPVSSGVFEAVDFALGKPRAVAAITFMGLVAALLGAAVSPVAGAVAVVLMFAALVSVFAYALRQRTLFAGPYDMLEDEVIWDFRVFDGSEVVVTKHQTVRFNYRTLVFVERASGDGDLFAEFSPDFGSWIHTGTLGAEKFAIVVLSSYRQRGEVATLTSDRLIRDGFLKDDEWVNYRIEVPSGRSRMELRFPAGRPPKRAELTRQYDGETLDELPKIKRLGGRAVWRVDAEPPRRGDVYELRWSW